MPFRSEAQRGFMFAKHPKIAKEFEAATPAGADLPEHVKKMADGGEVQPLDQTMQNLNQTPATNYDFYKDISAEDRARLYKQLTTQQNGPGMLAAQGVGGVGDAITNSFGHGGSTAQNDIVAQAQKNKEDQLGAMDTQRSQRMTDMQGNQEMMMNDPNHPISQAMRSMLQGQGINVPSGMNANLMMKALGPLGELAMKQATLAQTAAHNKTEEDIQRQIANQTGTHQKAEENAARNTLDLQTKKTKQEAETADEAKRLEAAKGLQGRPWYQKAAEAVLPDSDATKVMKQTIQSNEPVNHGVPDLGSTFNGGKVLKVTRVK